MRAAFSKAEIEAEISSRFGTALKLQEKRSTEVLTTGIPQIDSFIGGLPRGAITEIFGPGSSGRTSFMLSAFGEATRHEEICALVDTNNAFAPQSGVAAELNFERLLWVRCANNLEHAFKATDLLLQAGGFGLVMLDLGNVPAKSAKRIISSWWYRFRRTLEATPTALVVIAEESCVGSRAALALELQKKAVVWSPANSEAKQAPVEIIQPRLSSVARLSIAAGRRQVKRTSLPHANLLQGLCFGVECRRPLYLKQTNGDVRASASHSEIQHGAN
jgi:recombination protein RecA